MTEKEAKSVLALVLLGSAQRERSPEELAILRRYLLPLPFEPVMRRVELHVAQVGRKPDGRSTHAWITTPGELLEACGISDSVAIHVVHAMHSGGQVLPDLRSMEGWSYVAPNAALPPGVVEAQKATLEPPYVPPLALPLPQSSAATVAETLARIKALVKAKRIEPERTPRPPAPERVDGELAAADARWQDALLEAAAQLAADRRADEAFAQELTRARRAS